MKKRAQLFGRMVAHKRTPITSLKLYLKPEENAAYYVINEKDTGKVDM